MASSTTTNTISTFAAFAQIEPMKQSDLNEAGIKRCRDILRTRDANKNEYDKKRYFAVVRDYISMQFRTTAKYFFLSYSFRILHLSRR